MSKVLILVMVVLCAAASVSAQSEADSKLYVEGRNVTLKTQLRQVSYTHDTPRPKSGVLQVGPSTTYLKEGLRTREVMWFLGKPAAISERSENGVVVTTYEFSRGEGRVLIAEFVNDALVRSRTETRLPVPPEPRS